MIAAAAAGCRRPWVPATYTGEMLLVAWVLVEQKESAILCH